MLRKRWWTLLLAALVIASLFFPFLEVHPHTQLDEGLRASFPATISGWQVMLRGANALPVESIDALRVIDMQGWSLALGVICVLAACALCACKRRGAPYIAFVLSLTAFALFLYEAFHLSSLSNSLLFQLLLNTKEMLWAPALVSLALAVLSLVLSLKGEPLTLTDGAWRKLGGAICLIAVLCVLLPAEVSVAPEGFVDDPASVRAMNRSESLIKVALSSGEPLSAIGKREGVFGAVLTGDVLELEKLSGDSENIRGVFLIKSEGRSIDAALIAALALLILSGILAFIPKVDRWFSICLSGLAVVAIAMRVTEMVTISKADMFASATRQLAYLGIGRATFAPFALLLFAAVGFGCGALSVRYADSPYFMNPVPQGMRLRLVAIALGILSITLTLVPSASVSFYKPGKTKVQSTVRLSGVSALSLTAPDALVNPVDSKGKPLYGETAASEGGYNASAAGAVMRDVMTRFTVTSLTALALCIAGVIALALKRSNKIAIAAFLAAFVARALTWLLVTTAMPKEIGVASGEGALYISLATLVFAAFFSNFAHLKEMPKKYRLFLMMLPFLVAVFLFSYMPLYGWSYAFYNYKFGKPMSEQSFVGLQWFTTLFTNGGHLNNMVRVMKNTFAMSGLGILTSWMPMVFAILLNEVTRTRFKKLVQVFTTLPNFISWALVFSFAMAMFSMDTGIFSKFMLAIGAIDKPVAWLNSNEHIWIKMWAWNTWKGLGWGAIMYLAAIAGIDQELYEAARVDGAGRWKQMRYITLPGLLPTFFVLLLLSISNIINNGMDQYLVFQNPMNKGVIEVLDLYVYNITIASTSSSMYSFGTAIGILKTLFSVTLLFVANFASKKLRGESIV